MPLILEMVLDTGPKGVQFDPFIRGCEHGPGFFDVSCGKTGSAPVRNVAGSHHPMSLN